MGSYEIIGGKRLDGKLKIQSAKNAVLPMIAGAILTSEEVTIHNCPQINDVLSMVEILRSIGVNAKFFENSLVINSSTLKSYKISDELSKKMRSSVYLLGALISRCKKAVLLKPGGCKIGSRPIDIHIDGLKKLGIIFSCEEEINCYANKIIGNTIKLRFPSVGATINLMLASVFCDGVTTILNPAKEPEIFDFKNFLNSMGANVFIGQNKIVIYGVKKLHGTIYTPMPDRIEEATFLVGLQMTGGSLEIYDANAKNIKLLIDKFSNSTCKSRLYNDIIYVTCNKSSVPISFCTAPYPGFATDMQPQFMAYNTIANGKSIIQESIFEDRFIHVEQLKKMGADIKVEGDKAFVFGVKKLFGERVLATDLRGGAGLVLAGLVAEGKTLISDIHHIERGYFDFDTKLRAIGVEIKKYN